MSSSSDINVKTDDTSENGQPRKEDTAVPSNPDNPDNVEKTKDDDDNNEEEEEEGDAANCTKNDETKTEPPTTCTDNGSSSIDPVPESPVAIPTSESTKIDDGEGGKSDELASHDKVANSNSVGRRGDPRMHRAVAARLNNPNMSLLEALIVGGFQFPNGTEGDGKSDRNVYDADNVLLCQRKNQLSRRLRLAKRRTNETKAEVESLVRLNQQAKDSTAFLFDAQKMNQADYFNPSAASELHRNPALKRGYDGQGLDDLDASRLKGPDGNTFDNASLYASGMAQTPASISALLQQQRGLGQHQAYFPGGPFLPMTQQALGNPFLPNQVPLNFGIATQAPGPTQNQGNQNQFDRYFEMVSMGRQQALFPQQNLPGAPHGQVFNQQTLQNVALMNNPPQLQPQQQQQQQLPLPAAQPQQQQQQQQQVPQNPQGVEKPLSSEGTPILENGESTQNTQIKDTSQPPNEKFERAVEFFHEGRNELVKKCLTMAGYEESELEQNTEIVTDFEKMIFGAKLLNYGNI